MEQKSLPEDKNNNYFEKLEKLLELTKVTQTSCKQDFTYAN